VISLLLTVLDEESVIEGCILSAIEAGVGAVLVLDTGCTDQTILTAALACEAKGIPFYSRAHKWNGYGDARNVLLEAARELDPEGYSLTLDADEICSGRIPEGLTGEGYYVCRLLAGDWENWNVKLTSNAHPWRYEGALHEVPTLAGSSPTKLHGFEIINRNDGRSGQMSPEEVARKYREHAEHFAKLLEVNPTDSRSAYYLAQSLLDAGMTVPAMVAFETRLAMAYGFEEERYLSAWRVAQLRALCSQTSQRVEAMALTAIELRPWRNEARVFLCSYFYRMGRYQDCFDMASQVPHWHPVGDLFLVQRSALTALPRYWRAVSAARLGNPVAARSILASEHNLPQEYRAELEKCLA
jgi:hypothetical protein